MHKGTIHFEGVCPSKASVCKEHLPFPAIKERFNWVSSLRVVLNALTCDCFIPLPCPWSTSHPPDFPLTYQATRGVFPGSDALRAAGAPCSPWCPPPAPPTKHGADPASASACEASPKTWIAMPNQQRASQHASSDNGLVKSRSRKKNGMTLPKELDRL